MGRLISSVVPAGTVKAFAGSSLPPGYLWCDGNLKSTTDYPELFAAIQYTYGGSGSTFRLPDGRGRAVMGKDDMGGLPANRVTSAGSGINGTQLGAAGGTENHTLTAAQIPEHQHLATPSITYQAALSGVSPGAIYFAVNSGSVTNDGTAEPNAQNVSVSKTFLDGSGNSVTAGSAHSSVQPSIVFNYIIKY